MGNEERDFRYEHFFELSPDLLCIAGFDGYFKKINPAVAETLGYTLEELYARPINDFVYSEDKGITDKVREELRKERPLYNFENRYITKGGEIIWLSWTSLPVASDELIYAIAKNVSHRKRIEHDRNDLLTKLTRVNRELLQLNYTTSHDLRAPVNNLLSLFNMVDMSKVSDSDTMELLQILRIAGEKLKQTMNNYVDLLNEKNDTQPRAEEVDLAECLHNVTDSIGSLIQTSKAMISSDFSAAPSVLFNKAYMQSVFLNLVTNSIKYARPELRPEISIVTEKHDGITSLIFADNGQGFDMDKVRDDIFGLQRRFHNHADSKGIGLYLVYNHITSFGGKISVESHVNEGTKFTITFRS